MFYKYTSLSVRRTNILSDSDEKIRRMWLGREMRIMWLGRENENNMALTRK